MDQARQYYEDAVNSQPGYSLALCGLAGFHSMQYTFTTNPATLHAAADYAQKAIDADPTLADAWNWLGYASQRLGRVEQAYEQFRHAIRLDPNLFFPYYFAASIVACLGRPTEGLGLMQRAVELEPTLSYPIWALACLHTQLGNYNEALWAFQRTAAVDLAAGEIAQWPGYGGFHGECLRRVGRLDEARAHCLPLWRTLKRAITCSAIPTVLSLSSR